MFEAGWISMYEMPDMGNMTSTRVTLLPTVKNKRMRPKVRGGSPKESKEKKN
jgi:hypothetical protein